MDDEYEACLVPLRTLFQGNPANNLSTPLSKPPSSSEALERGCSRASTSSSYEQSLHNNQVFGAKLLNGHSMRLSFRTPKKLSPHLQLSVAPLSQLLGQLDPVTVENKVSPAVLKLSREACKKLEFYEMDKAYYERITGLRSVTLNEHYYLVLVDGASHMLCAERLFVEGCPDVLRSIRDYFHSDTKFGIFTRGPTQIRSSFSLLLSSFRSSDPSVERLNFLDRNLYDLRRRRLQPRDVPSISGESRLSFFNMSDYIATFGVGAMIESI
ncbi:hypothetical protein H2200_003715 [Cladophialophora chaetospira]|uniref:Uncharacterized protein n=1 Tax=Cladophialophora chaetospira TaxID=386627 RepID=A0AA38XEQ8_9EURO|nr:hypothetical protein H2200_003715 [Cladophialophora chaetospira]